MLTELFLSRIWDSYSGTFYNLTNYVWTLGLTQKSPFKFLNSDLVAVFQQRSGQDVTTALNAVLDTMNMTYRE
jgi:chitin synthase